VEKPQPLVMAPHDFANIKASVKVASTENGIIFGNIGNSCLHCCLSALRASYTFIMFERYAVQV
jgi:hypothetical protein